MLIATTSFVWVFSDSPGVPRARPAGPETSSHGLGTPESAKSTLANGLVSRPKVNRRTLLGGAAATAVLASVPWPAVEVRSVRTGRLAALTPRYRQVLGLMAQGMTNREIGAFLGVSQSTLLHHIQAILVKLNVSTRAGAIRLVESTGYPAPLAIPASRWSRS
jgi:DNA-binding NarL/FixJ family response regulator